MAEPGAQLPDVRSALPGPRGEAWVELLAASECPALTARRARRQEASGAPHDPLVWARALGANVWDADGNRYVDLSAGFGAAAIGHGHPRVVEAVRAQAGTLLHALGDLSPSVAKVELLTRLAALGPWSASQTRVMLGLNGADAVTAALKSAALYTRRPGVIAFEGSYHGLEYGPLAACGFNEGFRAPFAAQLNPHVVFAPYPRADAEAGARDTLEAVLSVIGRALDDDDALGDEALLGAVLVEPLLGRGGVVVPPAGFVAALARLCHARGRVLICDEVMTGCGRAGAMVMSATADSDGGGDGDGDGDGDGKGDADAWPDLICLGKALGGGLPVSACLGSLQVMSAWGDPAGEALHTSTFAGNPLGCAAALAALEVIADEGLCARSLAVGSALVAQLEQALMGRGVRVRGRGLLVGIELPQAGAALGLMRRLLERGFITVPAAADARVLSLTPPLTITQAQLDAFVSALVAALDDEDNAAARDAAAGAGGGGE